MKNSLFLVLVLLFTVVVINGYSQQVGQKELNVMTDLQQDTVELRKEKRRERITLLNNDKKENEFLSQHYIGIRGGVNGGSIIMEPYRENKMVVGNPEFGLVYRYIGGEKWVGGIAFELNFVKTAYTLLPRPKSDSTYTRTMTFLELPIFWHPQYEFADGRMRVFANIGPYLSYMLSSKYDYKDKKDPSSAYNRSADYNFNRFYDVRFGYGVAGGVGLSVLIGKRIELNIEGRYKMSFSDVWKNASKIDHNLSSPNMEQMFNYDRYTQTQINGFNVAFGLGYRFMVRDKSELDEARKKTKKNKATTDASSVVK